ncbi:MAG: hypothetical protein WCK90_04855 [archaeon]
MKKTELREIEKEIEDAQTSRFRADVHIRINLGLLTIAFAMLTFILTVGPSLIKNSFIVAIQLVLTIPLLTFLTLVRSKQGSFRKYTNINPLASLLFSISYGFLLNSIGILLGLLVNTSLAMIFFAVSIIMPIVYSASLIIAKQETFKKRLLKDALFIVIIIVLGILPALKLL